MTIIKRTMEWLRKDKLLKALSFMMVLSLIFSGYTLYKSLTLKPGQSVTISVAAKVEKLVLLTPKSTKTGTSLSITQMASPAMSGKY